MNENINYLAVDTSNAHMTVAARVNGRLEYSFTADSGVRHSEQLMPTVEKLLEKMNASVNDIDVFCAVTGPGSFTGIRIGVSTVKGFCDALGKKALGVTSFDTLSYNIQSGKTLAVIDANHAHFYACPYENGVPSAAEFIDAKRLEELAETYKVVTYGGAKFTVSGKPVTEVDCAAGLIKAVERNLEKASSNVNTLAPFYLRLSQAEEGRK